MTDYLFGMTDPGRVRDNNEDVFIAEEVMDGQFMIAGVIDGVGGYDGGEIAAALSKEIILAELAEVGKDVIAQLEIAFLLANEEIIGRKIGDANLSGMACVATVAVIDKKNNLLYYIHVGDTRLYLFRDNSLVKLSHDQSFVGFLEDSGRLTEVAAMQHPKRNQINQALGLASRDGMTDAYFETGTSPFLPGDQILLCSDGLTDMVNKEAISEVLTTSASLKDKSSTLINLANAAGGKDNVTVVLARNDKAIAVHETAKPLAAAAIVPPQPVVPVAPRVVTEAPVQQEAKSGNKGLLLLSVLCLALLATTIFLYVSRPAVVTTQDKVAVLRPVNTQEKWLRDTVSKLKGDTLFLSADVLKEPVRLSAALNFTQDTLVIRTKGKVVFSSDSLYKGPAMVFAASSKYVQMDSLVFENFETAIVSYNNALDLKNTNFVNCKHPLAVLFAFPDKSFVTGRISKRAYLTDSVSKK